MYHPATEPVDCPEVRFAVTANHMILMFSRSAFAICRDAKRFYVLSRPGPSTSYEDDKCWSRHHCTAVIVSLNPMRLQLHSRSAPDDSPVLCHSGL